MRIDLATLLADAGAMVRRDRVLLLGLAGPFLFLPQLALSVLVPAAPWPVTAPEPGSRESVEAAAALAAWVTTHGGWYLLAAAVNALGSLAVLVLYLDPDDPDVGAALARAGRLWPRFILMNMIAAPPIAAGWLLFKVPGMYVVARLMLAGPALVAERPLAAGTALGRGWRLSRGNTLPLFALVAGTIGLAWLVSLPLHHLDLWLRARPGGANPVALITVDAVMAAIGAAATLASGLVAVAAYRRLAR